MTWLGPGPRNREADGAILSVRPKARESGRPSVPVHYKGQRMWCSDVSGKKKWGDPALEERANSPLLCLCVLPRAPAD